MAPLAVVIALDPKGHVPLELLRADQLLAVFVELRFRLKRGLAKRFKQQAATLSSDAQKVRCGERGRTPVTP